MENNYLEEIKKLKADCSILEEQVKLLVNTEINLRRTKAELTISKEKIEEYNKTLEQRVEERTIELQKVQQQLIDNAHRAGMAEMATGAVHNIGNILNSVNVCSEEIGNTVKQSKLSELSKANDLLKKNKNNIANFLTNDPHGKKLIDYYFILEDALVSEQKKLKNEVKELSEKIEIIRVVILTQQDYALCHLLFEPVDVIAVFEDALTILQNQLSISNIVIKFNYNHQSKVIIPVQKSKLIQILINLMKNASEALKNNDPNNRIINIELNRDHQGDVLLSIADNGEGIKNSDLKKIFTHGFTTKKEGHGFGLHNCANFMADMGGKISVESEGLGKGAKFTLFFQSANKK